VLSEVVAEQRSQTTTTRMSTPIMLVVLEVLSELEAEFSRG
jgi:hypothetical protein